MYSSQTSAADPVAALERFVAENDDLLELEAHLARFNIFDALGIGRVEIRHSNALAFLLDPGATHGHGPLFLRALMMDVLINAPRDRRPLPPIELDGVDLRFVEVYREWVCPGSAERIDILIKCDEPRFVVAIENKIDSAEHGVQLPTYRHIVERRFPDHRPLYVYLTVDADDPSDDAWMTYSHVDVLRVLQGVRARHDRAIRGDVRTFLDHYLQLIETRLAGDAVVDELCRRLKQNHRQALELVRAGKSRSTSIPSVDECSHIYQNHRQALDVAFDRIGSPADEAFEVIKGTVGADKRWGVVRTTARSIEFVPREWMEALWPSGDDGHAPQPWAVMEFLVGGDNNVLSRLFILGMDDVELRARVIDRLLEPGQRMRLGLPAAKGKPIAPSRARVSTEIIFTWTNDLDQPLELRNDVSQKLNSMYPGLLHLPEVLAPVLAAHLGDAASDPAGAMNDSHHSLESSPTG